MRKPLIPHDTPQAQALEAAIRHCGTQQKLADAIGVSQMAIWSCRKQGRVSAEIAVAIESATGGAVMRHHLRPDLWSRQMMVSA
jgi:DNA-binding transcriptional regulator YdaS (Cro superfamily)